MRVLVAIGLQDARQHRQGLLRQVQGLKQGRGGDLPPGHFFHQSRHVLGVIGHALKFGDQFQGGANLAEVVTRRLIGRQGYQGLLLGQAAELIDLVIIDDDLPGQFQVSATQAVDGLAQGGHHHLPHAQQPLPQGLAFLLHQ